MDVNNKLIGFGTKSTTTNKTDKNTTTKNQSDTQIEKEKTNTTNAYILDIEEKTENDNNSNGSPINQKELTKLIEENEKKSQSMINLVNALFNKQAEKSSLSSESLSSNILSLKSGIENGTIEVDEETIKTAQADISEDGYYGVKQTSDRLVGFAKALSGGDPEKIELLRDSIIKGFKQVEDMWGDELPQISKDTFNATMDKLDEWANENGITLSTVERM